MKRGYFLPLLLVLAVPASAAPKVVDLKAPDGVVLKATYFAAEGGGPGVLLLHQCNRQRKVWDELAQQLTAAGINVLSFDLRGFGESGGARQETLTPQEEAEVETRKWPLDIETAFQYLTLQPGVTQDAIGVGGASCGVNSAIRTARRHPEQVKSLVLLSGGTDLAGRDFLRQTSRPPELFSMADDDEFRATVDIMPWLYSVASNPGKKFVHFTTGGHGADIFRKHPELRGTIVDWYVTTLIRTPGRAPKEKSNWPMPPWTQFVDELDKPGGAGAIPGKAIPPESIVNLIGYEHLQAGDVKGAVEILKLNVAAHPKSPNAYDSLGDAYLAEGQKDLARENAKKALELVSSDTVDPEERRQAIHDNSERKLKQLEDGK